MLTRAQKRTNQKHVNTGVAWLDEMVPNWRDRISTDLRMQDGDRCIVGHLVRNDGLVFGDVVSWPSEDIIAPHGDHQLAMTGREATARGFMVQENRQYRHAASHFWGIQEDWDDLTERWTVAIWGVDE